MTILSGVNVGHGAVLAAGCLVSRDVAPYSIVAGNPARPIRSRFTPEQIGLLLETSWWTLSESQLTPLIPLMTSTDVNGFLDALSKLRRA